MPQALVSGKKKYISKCRYIFFLPEKQVPVENAVIQYTIIQITIRLRVLLNPIILAINYKTHYWLFRGKMRNWIYIKGKQLLFAKDRQNTQYEKYIIDTGQVPIMVTIISRQCMQVSGSLLHNFSIFGSGGIIDTN